MSLGCSGPTSVSMSPVHSSFVWLVAHSIHHSPSSLLMNVTRNDQRERRVSEVRSERKGKRVVRHAARSTYVPLLSSLRLTVMIERSVSGVSFAGLSMSVPAVSLPFHVCSVHLVSVSPPIAPCRPFTRYARLASTCSPFLHSIPPHVSYLVPSPLFPFSSRSGLVHYVPFPSLSRTERGE